VPATTNDHAVLSTDKISPGFDRSFNHFRLPDFQQLWFLERRAPTRHFSGPASFTPSWCSALRKNVNAPGQGVNARSRFHISARAGSNQCGHLPF